MLGKNTTVITNKGLKKIKDLSSKSEIWDGNKFSTIFVTKNTEAIQYIVHLSNGNSIKCSEDYKWRVKDSILPTTALNAGDIINFSETKKTSIPTNLSTVLPSRSLETVKHFQTVDSSNMKDYIKKAMKTGKLPREVFLYNTKEILVFIGMWLDEFNGSIFGRPLVIDGLQKLLFKAHIYNTYVETDDAISKLFIGETDGVKIPNIYNNPRRYSHISKNITVVSVENTGKHEQYKMSNHVEVCFATEVC